MDWQVLALVVAAVGGVTTAVSQLISARRTQSRKVTEGLSIVDASEDVVNMYRTTLTEIREELKANKDSLEDLEKSVDEMKEKEKSLQRQINNLRSTIDEYRRGVSVLIGQLRRLGHAPEWEPVGDDER